MDVELNRRSFLAGMSGAFPHTSIGHDAHQATASMRLTGRSGDIDSNTIFDVCIIGSGFCRRNPGESLVRQGIKTVILESEQPFPRCGH